MSIAGAKLLVSRVKSSPVVRAMLCGMWNWDILSKWVPTQGDVDLSIYHVSLKQWLIYRVWASRL